RRVAVTFTSHEDQSTHTTEYQQSSDGMWNAVARTRGDAQERREDLEVMVKESFNDPPRLVATTKQQSRVIWDPNPQLQSMELGEASVYRWKDKEGREWKGGLYKPRAYSAGRCYPLVIQTHGFTEAEFRPSGLYPTAFAARALAASGIMVLQIVQEGTAHCAGGTPEEGPCAASLAESSANQLVSDGLADPNRIGIIGFSRSSFYVMENL